MLIVLLTMETFNFENLNRYSLTNDLFNMHIDKSFETFSSKTKMANASNSQKHNRFISIPKSYDQLFWCFYIFHKGIDEYNMVQNNIFSVEKQMKFEFVDIIRTNKALLKELKLTRTGVESELVNDKRISIDVFFLLCIYHKIDIIYIHNAFYYEVLHSNKTPNIVIFNNGNYMIDTRHNEIDYYRLNLCKMESIKRFIKPISAYKLDDLHNYALKLNIALEDSSGKRRKKQEIYDTILSIINK